MLLGRRRFALGLAGLAGLAELTGLAGCFAEPRERSGADAHVDEVSAADRRALSEPKPKPKPRPIAELWIAGDLQLGELDHDVLRPLGSIVSAGALGLVNLEGPLGSPQGDALPVAGEAPILTNHPGVPALLRELGVGVVGVTNNHADDLGEAGRRATIRGIQDAGMVPLGGDAGAAVLERDGLRLAFTAHYLQPGMMPQIAEELSRAKVDADHLIATFHVDGPPSYLPSEELRAAVDVALEAGAGVVAVHGSHALARIERRGEAVIVWGLGNLAFECACTEEVDGAVLRVQLDARRIVLAEWIPIQAGLHGAAVAEHAEAELLIRLIQGLKSSPGEVVDGRYRLDLGSPPPGR